GEVDCQEQAEDQPRDAAHDGTSAALHGRPPSAAPSRPSAPMPVRPTAATPGAVRRGLPSSLIITKPEHFPPVPVCVPFSLKIPVSLTGNFSEPFLMSNV